MDGRTAAAVLGITQGATRDEIRRAFRARAKIAHPDAHGTDEAFVTLRAAADLLLAAAPTAPGPQMVRTGSQPTAFGRFDGAALTAPAAAAPGVGHPAADTVGRPAGDARGERTAADRAAGHRLRWDHGPAPRPGAAIDLTDRPVGTRRHPAAPAAPTASGAAFARVLDAELARH